MFNVRISRLILERVDEVLQGGELRPDFFREAVERELRRREAKADSWQPLSDVASRIVTKAPHHSPTRRKPAKTAGDQS